MYRKYQSRLKFSSIFFYIHSQFKYFFGLNFKNYIHDLTYEEEYELKFIFYNDLFKKVLVHFIFTVVLAIIITY